MQQNPALSQWCRGKFCVYMTHAHTQMSAADSGKEGAVDDCTSPHPPHEDSGCEEDEVWAAMEMVGEDKRKSE